ncbi:MAG: holin [Bacillales bacterium]|nr:holin [Bacillales bacterium]
MLGGLTIATTTLLIFMCVDYLTGFMLSAFFKKSLKTATGGLSSKVGFLGLFKKCLILVFILISYRLDLLLGTNYIREGVCYAFIVNELISIIENCGLIGFGVPKIIVEAVDILKSRENKK